jgi:hypothetical protein
MVARARRESCVVENSISTTETLMSTHKDAAQAFLKMAGAAIIASYVPARCHGRRPDRCAAQRIDVYAGRVIGLAREATRASTEETR